MKELTNEIIIENLKKDVSNYNSLIMSLCIFLVIVGIIYFIKIIREKSSTNKKEIIISFIIFLILLIGFQAKDFLKNNAINYSLKNNCFEVVTDTIERKDDGKGYYVFLKNNGKKRVDSETYNKLYEETSAYIVIVKNRFGSKFATEHIYSTIIYEYENK